MKFEITLKMASLIIIGIGVLQFLLTTWTKARIGESIRSEYAKILEEYRYDIKVRERAARVAEYLSLYYGNSQNFQKLNQLSWELSLWLPSDIYTSIGPALKNIGPQMDLDKETLLDILIKTRKYLLKDNCGDLTNDNIMVHGKNIDKK
jgi:hypothetical protein